MKRLSIDYYLIGLLGVVAGVVYYKLPQLNVPYFWDEAWVYAPAVQEMYKNGLGLLPSFLPPELSRGHPLLFHFLGALWLKIFGVGFTSTHSYPLFISVLLLFAVYNLGKTFFSPAVGFSASLLLAVQPVFLSQSAMLLPEVMMALWTVLTLQAYLKEKKIVFIVFATLMLLTKESGIVLLTALGCWVLFENAYLKKKKVWDKEIIMSSLLLAVPVCLVSVFFIIQYFQNGWFFYPEHLGMVTKTWGDFHGKFIASYGFLFEGQGRYLLTIMFFISITLFWKTLTWIERMFVAMGYLVVIRIYLDYWWHLNAKLMIVLMLIVLAKIFQLIFIKMYDTSKEYGRILLPMAFFSFLYFCFSAFNYISFRYLIAAFPFVILTLVFFSYHILENKKWIFYTFIILSAVNTTRQLDKYEHVGDHNMCYLEGIKVQQDMVKYFEENNFYKKKTLVNFLNGINLTKQTAGYRSTENEFTSLTDTLTSDVEYCVFTNIEMDKKYDSLMLVLNLEHIKTFESSYAWIDLYKFKGFDNDTLKPSDAEMLSRVERQKRRWNRP